MWTSRSGRSTSVAVLADAAARADPHAVDRDVEPVRVEGGPGGADRGEHPAPVGVVAEDGALEQVVAGDRAADLDGVVLGRPRARPRSRCRGWRPRRRAMSCRARSAHTAVSASANSSCVRGDAGGAGGEQRARVVGRHAAVGVDPVEGGAGGRAERLVERGGVDVGVGGEDDEHRRQAGREHAGALRHAADRPAVRPGTSAVLATVSVVMIACAASSWPSRPSAAAAA